MVEAQSSLLVESLVVLHVVLLGVYEKTAAKVKLFLRTAKGNHKKTDAGPTWGLKIEPHAITIPLHPSLYTPSLFSIYIERGV